MTFTAPSFTADATALAASGYSQRVYLSAYVPTTPIASGTLLGVAAGSPSIVIGVTYVTGAYTDVKQGMEITFHDAMSGAFKGRSHLIFTSIPITAVTLNIREFNAANLDIGTGDVFKVWTEYRLHDKLVAATETFQPDYLDYVDEGSNPRPVANSGGHWAGQVDDGQTYATVQMTGSTSYTVDPDSGSGVSHLWTLPSGVTFHAGSANTDANPVLKVTQGKYVVLHAVTDIDNGVTTPQYVTLQCSDASHPPYSVFVTNPLTADENYVWHYTVRLFADATLDDLPDGALVVLWTRERVNATWQSFRNATPGRETILAVGYLYADKNVLDSNQRQDAPQIITFDVISPLQRLDQVAGYSKVMEENATPDAWSQVKSLTTSRAMIQLLAYYTTLTEAGFDLIFDATCNDYGYPALYLQRSTPLQQVRELAHGVDARFIADRTALFNLHTHPKYVPLASRSGITVTIDLPASAILHAEFNRLHYSTTELMKTSGFSSGSSPAPIFSLYPGTSPGEAINAPTVDRLICASGSSGQGDLNERTGRYGADVDQVFIDASGNWNRAFQLTLVLMPQYDFFDFYLAYVTLTIDGSSNLRGVDLSQFRYWVKSVQATYTAIGAPALQVVLQAETNAPAGVTYTPPASDSNGLPPISVPALPPLTAPINPALLGKGTSTFALFDSGGGVWLTSNGLTAAAAGGPTWVFHALSVSGTIISFVVDAYSPLYLKTGTSVDGWLLTTTSVYRITDIFGTRTLGTPHTLPGSATDTRSIQFERGVQNWGIIVSYLFGTGTRVSYTTDGSTWTDVSVNNHWDTAGAGNTWRPGIYLLPQVAGKAFTSAFTNNGAFGTAASAGFFTTDYGSTWSVSSNPNITPGNGLCGAIAASFAQSGGQPTYFGHNTWNGTGYDVTLLRANGSGTPVNISPTSGLSVFGPEDELSRSIVAGDSDPNTVLLIGGSNTSGSNVRCVALTHNAQAATPAWTQLFTPSSSLPWLQGYLADPNLIYLLGAAAFSLSGDGGVSFDSKLGNITGAGSFVGLCGGA